MGSIHKNYKKVYDPELIKVSINSAWFYCVDIRAGSSLRETNYTLLQQSASAIQNVIIGKSRVDKIREPRHNQAAV
jgi:hypothetical protein